MPSLDSGLSSNGWKREYLVGLLPLFRKSPRSIHCLYKKIEKKNAEFETNVLINVILIPYFQQLRTRGSN